MGTVDRDRCILCLGCVNNCPHNAVTMKFLGREIYGYMEFVKRNGLDFRHLPI
jgi:ferredoxin